MLARIANPQISACYDRVSRYVLETGNIRLDTGKVLVTDRMHPHVLAALRSQPSVVLPDRFGKNRAVYDYSSRNYSTVHWADTPKQALELARALVKDC
jgi:pyruvyl transferase EpsO